MAQSTDGACVMTPELGFTIANSAVLPAWILLMLFPKWIWTQKLVPLAFIVPLSAVYLGLLAANLDSGGGFGTLQQVAEMFRNPWVLLGGWIHYLAFDLFVGAWEVRDAQRLDLPHPPVVFCLFLTFMLGPIGLLMYLVLRVTKRRQWSLEESK